MLGRWLKMKMKLKSSYCYFNTTTLIVFDNTCHADPLTLAYTTALAKPTS